jgi:hypothetical protein
MSGINRQLFLYCFRAYNFLKFKGTPSFKEDKTISAFKDYRNKLRRINVAQIPCSGELILTIS